MKNVVPYLCVLIALATVQEARGQFAQWKLLPEEGVEVDSHGSFVSAVSVHGDRALVGADYKDANGINSGAVYVFEWDGRTWEERAKLLPEDGAADDHFGQYLSLSGDRALIGSPYDDDNGEGSGSVYVFERNGVTWEEKAKLLPADGFGAHPMAGGGDNFGRSLSLQGDRALIGGMGNDDNGENSGSAYVFDWNGSLWVETAKLLPNDGAGYHFFGQTVLLDGDRAFIGAPFDDDNGSGSGSVYVFEWNGSTWEEKTKMLPDDGEANDNFGWSMSQDGNRVIIGAKSDDDNGANSGSAYVFEWDGSTWAQTAKLLPDDGADTDLFGESVALDGDRVLVGAHLDDDDGDGSGSAYVFEWDGSTWAQTAKLLPDDGGAEKQFGFCVSVDGTRAVVGSFGSKQVPGSAYVFAFSASTGTDTERNGSAVPAEFALQPSYPNPFKSSTRITFDLPEVVHVRLTVYDVQGREVARLIDQTLPAGTHRYTWEAGRRPNGLYLVRMEAGSYLTTQALVLVK